ncbi:MAG: Nif3-like dinuclear metal center hexameric protein [Planctomycetota bacterium]|jgi:dinuclear metal center YbgI/SA1388 family protein
MAAKLRDIVTWLDRELDIEGFDDTSANGLQVEGRAEVGKVGLAVDACVSSFRAAAREGCDLLLVHHGLIWGGGIRAVTGVARRRLAVLLKNDISLYASHLPLDAHPRLGNNARLAKMLGLRKRKPFGTYRGRAVGFSGELPKPVAAKALAERAGRALSVRARVFGDAKKRLKKIGVVSGGGTVAVTEAAELGLDALLTGEGTHAAELEARETGVAIIYAGHYETETPGVKALGAALAKRFRVRPQFLDVAK